MADLEAVLADVSYLMAMEKSKCTPAARASKKIVLPDPRYAITISVISTQIYLFILEVLFYFMFGDPDLYCPRYDPTCLKVFHLLQGCKHKFYSLTGESKTKNQYTGSQIRIMFTNNCPGASILLKLGRLIPQPLFCSSVAFFPFFFLSSARDRPEVFFSFYRKLKKIHSFIHSFIYLLFIMLVDRKLIFKCMNQMAIKKEKKDLSKRIKKFLN